jgi:hypothetical protein
MALDAAESFTPIIEAEVEELKKRAKESTPMFRLAAA